MPIPSNKVDYLRKPSIDHRMILIDLLCETHGSCYRHMRTYRSLLA